MEILFGLAVVLCLCTLVALITVIIKAEYFERQYKETLGQLCVLQAEKGRVDTALKARETAYKKLEEYVKRLEDDTALKATRIEELRSNCDTKDQYIAKLKVEHQERIDKDTQSLAATLSENITLNKYKKDYEENVKVLESKDRVIADLDQRVFNLEKELMSNQKAKQETDTALIEEMVKVDTLKKEIEKLDRSLKDGNTAYLENMKKSDDCITQLMKDLEEKNQSLHVSGSERERINALLFRREQENRALEIKIATLEKGLDTIQDGVNLAMHKYGELKQYPSTLPALGNAVGGSTNEVVTPRSCSMTPDEKREFMRQVNKASEGKNVFTLKNEGEIND